MTTLEKLKQLERYLATKNEPVDQVLDTTIDKLLAREHRRLQKTKKGLLQQCKQFEKKYSLNSSQFYYLYEKGKMGDEMDFVEWAATVEMLQNLEKRQTLLSPVLDE